MNLTTRSSLLLLVFVVLGIYYPALFAPLNTIDDPGMYSYLLNTDDFSLRSIFSPNGGNYFRPVLIVSYMMDKYVWGLEESFMHLENIIFHLLNTLMVYAIARRVVMLKNIRSEMVPFCMALFFAIHPLHTEAVAWIAGRTDLLAAFFLFLSVWLLLRQSQNCLVPLMAAFCMLVACLAKETAIFFLPAAIIFPFFMLPYEKGKVPILDMIRSNLFHFLVFFVAGAAYFAFRTGTFTHNDAGVAQVISHVGGDKSVGFLLSLSTVFKAAGFYLKKLFIPFPLNFAITHVSDLYIGVGMLVFMIVLWFLIRRTIITYLFVCSALIGSSALMIPLLHQTWTPLAERYMYIPSAFFIIGLTSSVYSWEKRTEYKSIIAGACIIVVGIFVWGTVNRTILWQDNLAFYQDILSKSPDFIPAKSELAKALYAKGRDQEATSILMSLQVPDTLLNRQYGELSKAAALANRNDFAGARTKLNDTLKNPGKHEVLILQWLLEVDKQQLMAKKASLAELYPASVKTLSRLIELTGDPFYTYRLGVIQLQMGDKPKALQSFTIVVTKASQHAYYRAPAEKLVATLKEELGVTGVVRP